MSEYDTLLEEARIGVSESAKQYVPRMYDALMKEDSNLSPLDARHRIEKDCINFWSKRTILDALPAAAKNPVKQEAGRQSRKTLKTAADSAARIVLPATERRVLVTADGQQIEEDLHLPPVVPEEPIPVHDKAKHRNEDMDYKDCMVLEISIPDEQLESYRKSRPIQDERAKITRIRVIVDRRTEQVTATEMNELPERV